MDKIIVILHVVVALHLHLYIRVPSLRKAEGLHESLTEAEGLHESLKVVVYCNLVLMFINISIFIQNLGSVYHSLLRLVKLGTLHIFSLSIFQRLSANHHKHNPNPLGCSVLSAMLGSFRIMISPAFDFRSCPSPSRTPTISPVNPSP